MQWLTDAWNWLWSRYVDWELVLRFIQVLIWPFIALVGLMMVRPGRIVTALLENGGELGLGPATMKFAKRIEEIRESVDEDTDTQANAEPPARNPLEDAADPYATVLNGWGKVIEGMEEACRRGQVGAVNKRNPMETVALLRRADLIGARTQQNIQKLWDFRNRVVHAGSRKLERLGLTQIEADDYYASAVKVRRGILNGLHYREGRAGLGALQRNGDDPSNMTVN